MSFSIASEQESATQIVKVSGEADANAAAQLDDAIRGAVVETLADDRARAIVIDLSEASFLDSRTIGVLAGWHEQLQLKGWRLPIVCRDENLIRLFRITGLEQTLEFHESRAALATANG